MSNSIKVKLGKVDGSFKSRVMIPLRSEKIDMSEKRLVEYAHGYAEKSNFNQPIEKTIDQSMYSKKAEQLTENFYIEMGFTILTKIDYGVSSTGYNKNDIDLIVSKDGREVKVHIKCVKESEAAMYGNALMIGVDNKLWTSKEFDEDYLAYCYYDEKNGIVHLLTIVTIPMAREARGPAGSTTQKGVRDGVYLYKLLTIISNYKKSLEPMCFVV